jgi:uncharacterized protein with NRDE domain
MCLIFIALNHHPEYKLLVTANRDEFYNRKTAAAGYWSDFPNIIGGRDLEAQGTWMAMSMSGKISMITNYRDPFNIRPDAPSRGHLVASFLENEVTAKDYMTHVQLHSKEYNGFNLVLGTPNELLYHSNYKEGVTELSNGIHGLSNHLLDTPWPKVEKGKAKLAKLLSSKDINAEQLFDFLYDDQPASEGLPDTGIGAERERALSSMFIKTPNYGSRCSTVIMVDNNNHVQFSERVYDLTTFNFTLSQFEFDIR